VKDICARYDLPYNTGPFLKQLANVQRTILRLAFPGGHPRPKPGPYRGPDADGAPAAADRAARFSRPGANGSGPEQPTDGVRVSMPEGE
jgi:NADPH-dependent stearoyl-CoA 9-desaturase